MHVIPVRVRNCYKNIKQLLRLIAEDNGASLDELIKEFQFQVNAAQPIEENEETAKRTVIYMHRRNPRAFIQFLNKNRLGHLVLWTDARTIAVALGVRKLIHIKWNMATSGYDCSRYEQRERRPRADPAESGLAKFGDVVQPADQTGGEWGEDSDEVIEEWCANN